MLPGGFSYGDYLRAGAIAALAPIMAEVKDAAADGHADPRHLQRLPDARRGAPAARRPDPQRPPAVRPPRPEAARRERLDRVDLDFTEGQEIVIPLKNADGGYIASDAELDRLEGEGLVAFRYVGVNPNGSLRDIAGLTNERGNVVGLMPHPEHAVEPGFGPDTRDAMRSGVDGLPFFTRRSPPWSPPRPDARVLLVRERSPGDGRRRQTVPAGGHTPMMIAIISDVTSSCAMFITVSDDGRPSNTSCVMKRAAVKPAHRITAVPTAISR